jgi:heptosyltransferase-2
MPTAPADRERILVVGNAFLGDTVLSIPFLRNLRRRFPQAVIDVLVEPHAAAVLADCPYPDALIGWPRPPRSRRFLPSAVTKIRCQARWLRSRGYSRAYLLKRSFSSGLLAWLAGIPRRVGHATEGRGWFLSRVIPLAPCRHQSETYLDLLRADGFDVDDGHNENWVAPAAVAAVDALLADVPADRPRVFLAVRSTNPDKHWPTDRWARVVDRLVRGHGCEVFFCGGPADVAMHQEIVARLDDHVVAHVHDHTRHVPLANVAAYLSRMDLCVGVDSGLPHVAASLGLPVVTLFGPTDPNQWHPLSNRGTVVRSQTVLPERRRRQSPPAGLRWQPGIASMLDIGVEEVVASCEPFLRGRGLAPMRSLDLRGGCRTYEVLATRITSGAARAEPPAGDPARVGPFQPVVMAP